MLCLAWHLSHSVFECLTTNGSMFLIWQLYYCAEFCCRDLGTHAEQIESTNLESHHLLYQENWIFRLINALWVFFCLTFNSMSQKDWDRRDQSGGWPPGPGAQPVILSSQHVLHHLVIVLCSQIFLTQVLKDKCTQKHAVIIYSPPCQWGRVKFYSSRNFSVR